MVRDRPSRWQTANSQRILSASSRIVDNVLESQSRLIMIVEIGGLASPVI
jgi:hypothetical protein